MYIVPYTVEKYFAGKQPNIVNPYWINPHIATIFPVVIVYHFLYYKTLFPSLSKLIEREKKFFRRREGWLDLLIQLFFYTIPASQVSLLLLYYYLLYILFVCCLLLFWDVLLRYCFVGKMQRDQNKENMYLNLYI